MQIPARSRFCSPALNIIINNKFYYKLFFLSYHIKLDVSQIFLQLYCKPIYFSSYSLKVERFESSEYKTLIMLAFSHFWLYNYCTYIKIISAYLISRILNEREKSRKLIARENLLVYSINV